jgi:fatty-acyl-CoA synthase/benzoate-CoA ligase/fatty acid CoA ligase FadD22
VPQYGGTWDEIRGVAESLEGSGVDALWVNDHFQSPGRIKTDPTFDAFTTLAALAATTTRIRLGVAVLSASYRPPQIAAKMASVLDAIAGGRMIVGLGSGSDIAEHAAYGVAFGTPAERTAGVRQALAVMDAMWDRPEGANVAGFIAGAPNRPLIRRPPVWLAAHGPLLLGHAGRHADGIIAAWSSADELAARVAVAAAAAAAAGRPPLAVALYTFCLVGSSEDDRRRLVGPQAARLGTSPERLLRWLGTTGLVGTADQVRERLAEYTAVGVTDVILALPERVPREAYTVLAEALAPAAPSPPPARAFGVSREANLVHALVGRHRSAGRGATTAVIDADGRWSYDELWVAARQAAGALARAGARRGDRVAVALRDGRPWIAAFLGCAWLGAVAVPVDPMSPADRVTTILEDCEPRLVVADGECQTGAWPLLDPTALGGGEGPDCARVHPEDLAYMIYSSGSTGRPKGVMHAHRDVVASVETYARHILELAPGEPCHSAAKLFTSLGFGNGFFRVLGAGATTVLNGGRPNPRTTIELTARHGIRVLTGVPTFWAQLIEYLRRHPQPDALAGVRLCVSSGDSLPAGIAMGFAELIGVPLIEGLGCSECSNVVISTRPGAPEPGWLGRVVPGVEIALRDSDGRDVPEGAPGQLWIRSPSNTSGYWRRAAATRELVYGEWIRMGDVLVAHDGRYRHVGRVDDLFKVDARWVSPREVESCLLEHAAVREAAVGGVADAAGLIRVVAWIVPEDQALGGLPADLRRHVARHLAPYMAPRQVILRTELPRLPSGKLDRKALRDRAI